MQSTDWRRLSFFARIFHRRPINVGVIAGYLWQAHSRRTRATV